MRHRPTTVTGTPPTPTMQLEPVLMAPVITQNHYGLRRRLYLQRRCMCEDGPFAECGGTIWIMAMGIATEQQQRRVQV